MSSPTPTFGAGTGQLLPPASKSSGSSLTPTLPVMVSSAGAGVGQGQGPNLSLSQTQSRQPTPLSRVPRETRKIVQTQDAKNPAWKMLNQYRVIRLLGRGTHGTVKYGEDMSKDDLRDPDYAVAIKIIKRMPQRKRLPRADGRERTNSALSRIRYEVAVMKRCSHDHIVRLIEVIDDPRSQAVFLVMEYLEGGEIKWRGPEKPLLSLGQTRRIVRDVLLGLEYLHYMGIIHRDIKPANMLWTKGRARVKLTDFGVAHFSKPLHPDGSTPSGTARADDDEHLYKTEGTPAFYAPEQAYNHNGLPVPTFKPGKRPAGVKNDQIFPMTKALDIWAFGVSIYCFLFGKPPYLAPNVHLLCKEIIETKYYTPSLATADQLPTNSDNPDLKEALRLMEGMMTKPVHARITLAEAKVSPWLTGDLDDPAAWLRDTDPEARDTDLFMLAGNETEKAVATKGHASRVSTIMKALWHRRENARHPHSARSDIKSIKGGSQVSLEHSTHRQLPSKPRSLYRPSADQPSSPTDGPSVTSSASSPTGTGHFGEFYFSRALVASGSHNRSGGLTRMVSSLFRRSKKSTSAEAIMSAPVAITPIRPLDNISASSSPPGEVVTSMQHRTTYSVDEAEMDPLLITYSSEEDDDDEEDDVNVRLVGFGGYETPGLNSSGISPSEASQSLGRIRRHDGDRVTRSGPVLGRALSTSSDMPERIYDPFYPQHTHKATGDDFETDTVTEPPSSPKQQTIYIPSASAPPIPAGHSLVRSVGRNQFGSDDDSDDEEEGGLQINRHRARHNEHDDS